MIKKVGNASDFTTVPLITPSETGFLLLAFKVDVRPRFAYFLESAVKKALLAQLKIAVTALQQNDTVVEASLFKTLLVPPAGKSHYLQSNPEITPVNYDVVLLVECHSVTQAQTLRETVTFKKLVDSSLTMAKDHLLITASNIRQISPVDHSKPGVFLFNFFFSNDREHNLQVWDYTANWFCRETGLDNSRVLLPATGQPKSLKIINHCRWNRLRDIIPSLVFKPSFKRFVLANFNANNIAAVPVLYRLVR